MGAWGSGNFDNDTALDWLAELDDPVLLRETLAPVAEAPDQAYLSASCCCSALAAAEVVAACCGFPAKKLPEKAAIWSSFHSDACDAQLVALAERASRRIESRSELQEVFDEGGTNEEWHGVVKELWGRLFLKRS